MLFKFEVPNKKPPGLGWLSSSVDGCLTEEAVLKGVHATSRTDIVKRAKFFVQIFVETQGKF